MYIKNKIHLPVLCRGACIFILVCVWLLGLFLGIDAAASMSEDQYSWMRLAADSRVSIVRLLPVLLLPFLISALAVYASQRWLMYLVCFAKTFSFGFCGYAIQLCFSSAGWLARFLLLFSDCCALPLLCWYCLRHIFDDQAPARRDALWCFAAVFAIACADLCMIAPFLEVLINT